jgi:hypothetical protein
MKRLVGLLLVFMLALGMMAQQAVPAAAVPSYGSFQAAEPVPPSM